MTIEHSIIWISAFLPQVMCLVKEEVAGVKLPSKLESY